MRLAAGLVAIALAAAAPVSDFDDRADRFNEAWNKFYRTYLGCPAGARQGSDCKPQLGVLDRPKFARARKAAAQLFDFRE